MAKTITKVLVEAGRVVGKVEVARGATGVVEYGRRNSEGVLHTNGIARIVSVSEAKKAFGLDDEWLANMTAYEC